MIKQKTIKSKPITTIEMEVAIAKMFGIRQHIIVPNLSWGFISHECDLFLIRKSGYGIEVEIKRTKSDLLKDFKKVHQHIDYQHKIAEFYFAIPIDILKKCEEYIPESAGIIVCERYAENVTAKFYRNAKRISKARRLTTEEQLKVARLGCMRIFPLKSKIIKLQNGHTKI